MLEIIGGQSSVSDLLAKEKNDAYKITVEPNDDETLAEVIKKEFDLRPAAIIDTLGLQRPIYAETSAYGHFGREVFPWERTDRTESLKKYLK